MMRDDDGRESADNAAETVPVVHLSLEPPTEHIDWQQGAGEPSEASGEPRPRRKYRKRTKKAERLEPEEPTRLPPDPQDLAAVSGALALGFRLVADLVARRRGAHWTISPEEARGLGDAWAAALAPYLSAVAGALPWALALGTTYAVVAPRLELDLGAGNQPAKEEDA